MTSPSPKKQVKTLLLPVSYFFGGLMEVHVHRCPRAIQDELDAVFPEKRGGFKEAILITTAQQAGMDLVRTGVVVDVEKDRLLEQFVKFARAVAADLTTAGHWADYIDPCSGMPGLSRAGSSIFSEVDCFEMLLHYTVSNTGCCKVIHHPVWGSAVYPASIVALAPLYDVESALGALKEVMG